MAILLQANQRHNEFDNSEQLFFLKEDNPKASVYPRLSELSALAKTSTTPLGAPVLG